MKNPEYQMTVLGVRARGISNSMPRPRAKWDRSMFGEARDVLPVPHNYHSRSFQLGNEDR